MARRDYLSHVNPAGLDPLGVCVRPEWTAFACWRRTSRPRTWAGRSHLGCDCRVAAVGEPPREPAEPRLQHYGRRCGGRAGKPHAVRSALRDVLGRGPGLGASVAATGARVAATLRSFHQSSIDSAGSNAVGRSDTRAPDRGREWRQQSRRAGPARADLRGPAGRCESPEPREVGMKLGLLARRADDKRNHAPLSGSRPRDASRIDSKAGRVRQQDAQPLPPAKILERELGAGDLLSHLDEPDQVAELALVEPQCGHPGRRRRGHLRDSRGPGGGARYGRGPRGPGLTDFLRSLQQVVGVVRIPWPPDRHTRYRAAAGAVAGSEGRSAGFHELGPRTRHVSRSAR